MAPQERPLKLCGFTFKQFWDRISRPWWIPQFAADVFHTQARGAWLALSKEHAAKQLLEQNKALYQPSVFDYTSTLQAMLDGIAFWYRNEGTGDIHVSFGEPEHIPVALFLAVLDYIETTETLLLDALLHKVTRGQGQYPQRWADRVAQQIIQQMNGDESFSKLQSFWNARIPYMFRVSSFGRLGSGHNSETKGEAQLKEWNLYVSAHRKLIAEIKKWALRTLLEVGFKVSDKGVFVKGYEPLTYVIQAE